MYEEKIPYEELLNLYKSASELNKKYVKEINILNDTISKFQDMYEGEKIVKEYYHSIIRQFEIILGCNEDVED